MGNCYSAGQEDLETSLAQNKTLSKEKAHAGIMNAIDETPEGDMDLQENFEKEE